MKNKKLYVISTISCLIPIAISLFCYNNLPNQIPIHWNAAGEIDNYASKWIALFALPLGLVLLHMFTIWAMDKDPKHKNIPKIMYQLMYFLIPLLSIFVNLFTINASLENGLDLNISTIMPFFIGLLLMLIGNFLPKCKQSYTVGIKTPWALDDEENWKKTHRFAGFIWMIGGLLIMLFGFISPLITTYYIIVIVLIMAGVPYIYSYMLYRKRKVK